jgi:CRP-like cAMP-binding protein
LGKKDFVGVPLVLGMRASPHRCTVQVPGRALRIKAEDLIALMKRNLELEKLLLGYVQAILLNCSQLLACNSRHTLLQRAARWLLVANDRLGSDQVPFTHSHIAQALAVRRAGVTNAIGELERQGSIRCSRGRIVIVDGRRLKYVACDCHNVIRFAHERSLSAASSIDIQRSKYAGPGG